MTVLAVFGVLLLVVAIIGGIVAYKVMSSPEGQKAVSLIGEGAKMTMDSMNAPGTKELKAMGCNQGAAVVDTERLQALGAQLDSDGGGAKINKDARLMVVCQVGARSSSPPSCDAVAGTYITAVGGKAIGPFVVTVSAQGDSSPKCSVLYGANAGRIRDWKE
jgi:rhodanese-related sulfurtransferase